MNVEDKRNLDFLSQQLHDHGANVEVDTGAWMLFAVAAADEDANAIARSQLASVTFAHNSGLSEDDQWMVYYVNAANQVAAMHWLEDSCKVLRGEIRPLPLAVRPLIRELADSAAPHRIAQRLVEMSARGEITAGCVHEPTVVRSLLDRLHAREPLFFSAFQILLTHHLLDMIVLLQQIIPEDVGLENEIVKGSLSRDPFLQTRQTAAADIRNVFIRFHVINPLDQEKNTTLRNPYAAYMEVFRDQDRITAAVDGSNVILTRPSFIEAIHSIRRDLYRGGQLESLNTQAPWMREDLAYSFRFIKQRLDSHGELSPMDGLYMLERALDP